MSSTTLMPAIDPKVPGTSLAGKYRVERVLGQGGMGVVVQARHLALDESVAIKFLLPEHARNLDAVARFLREAKAAVRIRSEHIARVSDVGTLETGAPYMVMELLQGADLGAVLASSGRLPVEDAVDFVIQGAQAIAEAHGYGIVHRDLKPANLFLGRRPNGQPLVKVLDFGISKVAEEEGVRLTRANTQMGSLAYMSPEQMRAALDVDHRADVYGLGVTLYELLTGALPFDGQTYGEMCALVLTGTPTPLYVLRPEIPRELVAVVEKAFARNREDRYASVADLVAALAPFAPARSRALVESMSQIADPLAATAFGQTSGVRTPTGSRPAATGGRPRALVGVVVGLGLSVLCAAGVLTATLRSRAPAPGPAAMGESSGVAAPAAETSTAPAAAVPSAPAPAVELAAPPAPTAPAVADAPGAAPSAVPSVTPVTSALTARTSPSALRPRPAGAASRKLPKDVGF